MIKILEWFTLPTPWIQEEKLVTSERKKNLIENLKAVAYGLETGWTIDMAEACAKKSFEGYRYWVAEDIKNGS